MRHPVHECQRERLYFAQGIKAHHDRMGHREQMRPRVKRLPVTFSARFRADLEDFVPVEVLAEFAKTGCPVKNVLLAIAFCLAIILPDTNN